MAEVIGLIASFLGIISFGINNLPKHQEEKTTVRIGVGLDTNGGLYSAGGDVPDVRAWDEGGEFLGGTYDPGTVDDGNFFDVSIDMGSNTQQAPYILLSANDDGICLAYTSTTWADGSHYGWVGDWGKLCGGSWYYSNIFWHEKDYKPLCTWVGSSPQTGISFHLPSFNTKDDKVPKNVTTDDFCGNPGVFQIHTEPDPSAVTFLPVEGPDPTSTSSTSGALPTPTGKKIKRESQKPVPQAIEHQDKLVISDDGKHHATENLCKDPNSHGPDFVNVAEGQFCRMSDKSLWAICSRPNEKDCFDLDSHQLITKDVSERGTGYTRVIDWRSGSKA